MLDDVEVEVFGEEDNGEYASKLLASRLTKIRVDDVDVPCFTLEAEAQTYAEVKQEQKAKLIRDFLREEIET